MSSSPSLSDAFTIFSQDYESVLEQNRARLSFFRELAQEFQAAGIPVLPLKGMDLLIRAYPSLGMRPMADIDLLIKKEDIRKVISFFEKKGFTRRPDEGLTYLKKVPGTFWLNVDIVWDFWYCPEDMEAIWERTSNGLLHPEDDLIYQVAYAVAHRGVLSETFARDLEFFLEKEGALIDWPRLAEKVRSLKLRPVFFHGLSYANLKNADPALFAPASMNERALAFLFRHLVTEAPQPKISYLFTWLGYPGILGKLRLLREKFLPTPLELEIRRGIASPTGYLAYLIFHPVFLFFRGLGFALRAVWRSLR